MNYRLWGVLPVLILFASCSASQRLKKDDRAIVSNFNAHLAFLGNTGGADRRAGGKGEDAAAEYASTYFRKNGLKPAGDQESGWYQRFDVVDGTFIRPSSYLNFNGKNLTLYRDYFPLPLSASKSTEAAVAVSLAENGVPWFKELEYVFSESDSVGVDTLARVSEKAKHAASKGATALILYNRKGVDLYFDSAAHAPAATIPVLYIMKPVVDEYLNDETAVLDVKLNIQLEQRKRRGRNIIAFVDAGSDSTVIASAPLSSDTGLAALMELSRYLKVNKPGKNVMLVAYSGSTEGGLGKKFFDRHPVPLARHVHYKLELDTLQVPDDKLKGLHLVKRSADLITKQ